MMAFADWVFGILSESTGWIWAVLVAIVAIGLAFFVSRVPSPRRDVRLAGVLVGGLALSGALLVPFALAAFRHATPNGPFQVRQAIVKLPPTASSGYAVPIVMQIWFPSNEASELTPTLDACAKIRDLPLVAADGSRRLLLYMPHLMGPRDDNSARLAYLASYGFVVVAFDDIALDKAVSNAATEDQGARLFDWRMTTQADYDSFLSLLGVRVKRQAEKALSGLDRIAGCATENPASQWYQTVDYKHVGFLGYSFGGATAAEAAAMDERIVAVASLDGKLYGQAFAGRLSVPYLYILSDHPLPTVTSMTSSDPQERYFARLNARDLRKQASVVAQRGSAGIRIKGSMHASFSDAVFEPHLSGIWLFENPIAFSNAVNLYTHDFFNARLRGRPATLIDKQFSEAQGIQTFGDLGMTPDGNLAGVPRQDASGAPIQ